MNYLIKILITSFIVSSSMVCSFGQTMTDLFLKLPNECIPEINKKERQILLQKGEYIIPGGDSIDTEKYDIEEGESTKDFLRVESSFTTGQRAFLAIELRIFKKSNDDTILIYSRYGGAEHFFYQQELIIFNIRNGGLKENMEHLLQIPLTLWNF
jgi:hypothetical protein